MGTFKNKMMLVSIVTVMETLPLEKLVMRVKIMQVNKCVNN